MMGSVLAALTAASPEDFVEYIRGSGEEIQMRRGPSLGPITPDNDKTATWRRARAEYGKSRHTQNSAWFQKSAHTVYLVMQLFDAADLGVYRAPCDLRPRSGFQSGLKIDVRHSLPARVLTVVGCVPLDGSSTVPRTDSEREFVIRQLFEL